MFICILKNEFITLLGYKSIRLASHRIVTNTTDLKIFSHAPNIKIGDSTGQIILELEKDVLDKKGTEIYINDEQIKTVCLDQIICCHLIKADDELQALCHKHQLPFKDNEFKNLWKNWLLLETSRVCHDYSYFVAKHIIGGQSCDSLDLEKIIKSLINPSSPENKEINSFTNLLRRTRSVIDSSRECINQNQYALIELPLVFIEESLEEEIKFDEIESNTNGLYPGLISNRLKNQKFYGQVIADSEIKNFFAYLSQTYPTIFDQKLSPLGVTTYLISCDQIFTKSFNPKDFESNIKRLSIESNSEEAFLIAFMVAAQRFIKDII